jgi:hypothetical protein
VLFSQFFTRYDFGKSYFTAVFPCSKEAFRGLVPLFTSNDIQRQFSSLKKQLHVKTESYSLCGAFSPQIRHLDKSPH